MWNPFRTKADVEEPEAEPEMFDEPDIVFVKELQILTATVKKDEEASFELSSDVDEVYPPVELVIRKGAGAGLEFVAGKKYRLWLEEI